MIIFQRKYHFEVWHLAWPMILTNISVPLLGAIDTAILGHLDSALYLGAVAVGSSVLTFIFWAFGFLRMGTTSLVARAFGKNDLCASALLLFQSVFLALLLAATLFSLQLLIFPLALTLIDASSAVTELAKSYCQIRIYSAPATLMNFALIGWFIGQQNTRAPLIIVVIQNLLNVVLDWLFIVEIEMNADGAAIATVIAEYVGLLIAACLAFKCIRTEISTIPYRALVQWQKYSELMRVNRHIFVRTAALLFTFSFFTAQGAKQGDETLAANALLFQLLLLISYGLDGFAHAAEAMVGKAVGAKNKHEFIAACTVTSLWALLTAVLFSLFFGFNQSFLLSLFTDIQSVIDIASQHYYWIVVLPLLGIVGYQLDGIFIGAGKTKFMQNSMLLSVFAVFIPLFYLFKDYGNVGLWLAFSAFMFSRGLFLGAAFAFIHYKNRWFFD